MEGILNKDVKSLEKIMWDTEPKIRQILADSESTAVARDQVFTYLSDLERQYFNIYNGTKLTQLHICERRTAKECIQVLKNVIRTENEQNTGFSALKILRKMARGVLDRSSYPSAGFFQEFIHLFRGINGHSGVVNEIVTYPENHALASQLRSRKLNSYAGKLEQMIRTFPKGTDPDLVKSQKRMKAKILKHFHATEKDWQNHLWQMRNIISGRQALESLVKLSEEEADGILEAEKTGIPFQITPYYLSLFNEKGPVDSDRAVRAQVLPSKEYCEKVAQNRMENIDMDFMGEKSTSPIHGITRRYPQIVILKPIDTCPQLCVYCQRNWEIKSISDGGVSDRTMEKAIDWIRDNEHITEVLITGGDPLMLPDAYINRILRRLAAIPHVERIRIGSRIPVTLPFRITPALVGILKQYHVYGVREICVVTHFEHSTEMTPEVIQGIRMIREAGISMYNQQVFTYYNSRRYETSALRRTLKLAGIDPYYSFNTKGKEETSDFRVPIARIQQERKEEARFLPGMVRTDEPVFNVPKLGKSHLRSGQDHEIVMITAKGERIYRFYPWESRVTLVDDYLYTDTPIFDYLQRLGKDKEHPEKYRSIWYYF
jgi:lysine 2,3-aminomutase